MDRFGTVTYDSARYIADYIGKALTGERSAEYGLRVPPFQHMSKGIGRAYVDAHKHELRQIQHVTVRGVQVGLPRYYGARLEVSVWKAKPDETVVRAPSSVRRSWGIVPSPDPEVDVPRAQKLRDSEARVHLFRKGL